MIAISNAIADPDGRVLLRHLTRRPAYDGTARISRVKTLDGDGVLTHNGVAAIDGQLEIECRLTAAQFATLKGFYENSRAVVISYWAGAYLGYIYRLRAAGAVATIVIYFEEQLA